MESMAPVTLSTTDARVRASMAGSSPRRAGRRWADAVAVRHSAAARTTVAAAAMRFAGMVLGLGLWITGGSSRGRGCGRR